MKYEGRVGFQVDKTYGELSDLIGTVLSVEN